MAIIVTVRLRCLVHTRICRHDVGTMCTAQGLLLVLLVGVVISGAANGAHKRTLQTQVSNVYSEPKLRRPRIVNRMHTNYVNTLVEDYGDVAKDVKQTIQHLKPNSYDRFDDGAFTTDAKVENPHSPFSYLYFYQHISRFQNIFQRSPYYVTPDSGFKTSVDDFVDADNEGKTQVLCVVLGICGSFVQSQKPPLSPVYEFKQLEFDYPSDFQKQADITSGFYVPTIPAPIDVDVFYGPESNKVFTTIPRFQIGSPVTLGIVTQRKVNGNPVITPYPDWSWQRNPDKCQQKRLVSVYRIKIDQCGKLWALDTGRYGALQTCDPQLIAFNLYTNEVDHQYTIPRNLIESRSILVTPVVDVRDTQCKDTFVYIADCQTYSIIVYDVRRRRAWQVTDKTMYPYPNHGTYHIQGDQFDLMDGILGMDLEPYKPGRDRKLFYHAMSSATENYVHTSDLRNESRFLVDPTSSPQIFHTYAAKRSSQSCAMAIDKDGISYFGLMSPVTLNCWNTGSIEYGTYINTIATNTVTLQFISGAKIINNLKGSQELWILSSRFQKVATGTINPSETNFRIMGGKTSDLLDLTNCRSKGIGGGYGNTFSGSYGLKPTN